MAKPDFIPLADLVEYPVEEMKRRARIFRRLMEARRSVRHFSERSVPREVLEDCLRVAGSAPSGANMQPWHFHVVEDTFVKRRVRVAAEKEERAFYHGRAPEEWLEALEALETDEHKPFLEHAPCLIVVFAKTYGEKPDGTRVRHYYTQESVGIATGMLITALHNAGLASLTHTPSPMGFLSEVLHRPKSEKPFLILVVGYPAEDSRVPNLAKKSLAEYCEFV